MGGVRISIKMRSFPFDYVTARKPNEDRCFSECEAILSEYVFISKKMALEIYLKSFILFLDSQHCDS